jgi:hypothetical protein
LQVKCKRTERPWILSGAFVQQPCSNAVLL